MSKPHEANARGIIDEVNKVKVEDVKFEGNKALIEIIGEEIDKIYLKSTDWIRKPSFLLCQTPSIVP